MSHATLRWTVADAWTMTRRTLLHWRRSPGAPLVAVAFPVLLLVLFGYLMGGQMEVPGGVSYFELLVPGLFALTMAFGVEATMLAVSTDASRGVTDHLRSMPMASSAVLAGRAAADMLQSAIGLLVLAAVGVAVGWRWHEGAGDALVAFALLLWLRFALVWAGILLGLLAKGPESVMAVQILVWPVGFLSSAFVSPASMPGWLGAIAQWNPLSATAAAVRERFGNPAWGGESWATEHAELLAVLWPLALLVVLAPLAVRRWRSLGA